MKVREFILITSEDDLARIRAVMGGIAGKNHIGPYKSVSMLNYPLWKLLKARKLYSEGNVLHLCSATLGIGIKELLNRPYEDLIYFLKWVEEQLGKVQSLEAKLNQPDPDEMDQTGKLEAAGIKDLGIFDELNVIDELAGGDPLKWEAIQGLPYKAIYTKLLRNKIKSRVQRRYQELSKPIAK